MTVTLQILKTCDKLVTWQTSDMSAHRCSWVESRLRNTKLKTHRANLLDIIPLLKNTDDNLQNEDHSILLELYERNLSVINGADVELVADGNNIDEN